MEDPTFDIDHADFNAQEYFKFFVKDKNVQDLLKKNNNLFSEIKNLDGEMQTLVFDNYNKFIGATDTVSRIKVKVESMSEELKKLEHNISNINHLYSEIDKKTSNTNEEIAKYTQIGRELDKLQFLRDLPPALEKATNIYSQTENVEVLIKPINQYLKSTSLLEKYKTSAVFNALYSEISNHIIKIKVMMRKSLEKKLEGKADIYDNLLFLIRLNEDKWEMRNTFIKTYTEYLDTSLSNLEEHILKIESEEVPPSLYIIAFKNKLNINKDLSKIEDLWGIKQSASSSGIALVQDQKELESVFDDLLRTHLDNIKTNTLIYKMRVLSDQIIAQFHDAVIKYRKLFLYSYKTKSFMDDQSDVNVKALLPFVQGIFAKYFAIVKKLVIQGHFHFEFVKILLKNVENDVQYISECAQVQNDFMDRTSEIIEFTIRTQVEISLKQLYKNTEQLLVNLSDECGCFESSFEKNNIDAIIDKKYTLIIKNLTNTLAQIQPLICSENAFQAESMFLTIFHGQVVEYFFFMKKIFIRKTGRLFLENDMLEDANFEMEKEKEEINGLFILCLIQISLKLQKRGISKFTSKMKELFHSKKHENTNQSMWNNFQKQIPFIEKSIQEQLQALVNNFVFLYGQKISDIWRTYLDQYKWSTFEEPRDVKPEMVKIYNLLLQIDDQLTLLFPSKRKKYDIRKGIKLKNKTTLTMEYEMERFLAKKLKIYESVGFYRDNIILSIMNIGFKAFYEWIRQLRFSQFGYQQIQIDSNFIYIILTHILTGKDNTGVLNGMMNEVKSCCKLRSIESEEMDQTVLETIIQFKIEKIYVS